MSDIAFPEKPLQVDISCIELVKKIPRGTNASF